MPMHPVRHVAVAIIALSFVIAAGGVATAQMNCEAIPAGPARTDCYIGLSRIGAGNAAIAGTKSKLQSEGATLQQVTGQPVKPKPPRKKKPRRPAAG
jgi:hypothetical protein